MTTKHSPGPWSVGSRHTDQLPRIWSGSDDSELIAHVYDIKNAPVIAAAPALLAALRELYECKSMSESSKIYRKTDDYYAYLKRFADAWQTADGLLRKFI